MTDRIPRPPRGAVIVAAVAAGLMLPPTIVMALASLPMPAGPLVIGLCAAAHAALAWRSTRPDAVLVAVAALLAGTAAITGLFVLLLSSLLLLLALHAAAAHGDRRLALALTVLGPVAAAARYGLDPAVSGSGFGPAPWLLGILMLAVCAVATTMGLLRRAEMRAARLTAAALAAERRDREHREERAAAQERARIALDLHDVLAHSLTAILAQSRVARFATTPAASQDALEEIEAAARESLRDLRSTLRTLQQEDAQRHPAPSLADLPEMLERMARRGLAVTRRVQGAPQPMGAAPELAMHRALQEALTNALRHGTGTLDWQERWEEDRVVIMLRNEIPAPPRPTDGTRTGLAGMRERLRGIGGDLVVETDPGTGFSLRLWAPLPARTEAGR